MELRLEVVAEMLLSLREAAVQLVAILSLTAAQETRKMEEVFRSHLVKVIMEMVENLKLFLVHHYHMMAGL